MALDWEWAADAGSHTELPARNGLCAGSDRLQLSRRQSPDPTDRRLDACPARKRRPIEKSSSPPPRNGGAGNALPSVWGPVGSTSTHRETGNDLPKVGLYWRFDTKGADSGRSRSNGRAISTTWNRAVPCAGHTAIRKR